MCRMIDKTRVSEKGANARPRDRMPNSDVRAATKSFEATVGSGLIKQQKHAKIAGFAALLCLTLRILVAK